MKKVLIVDDEQDIRVYLSRLFEENGYQATCAIDGDAAMQAVQSDKPDLVTLDLSMPGTSGVRFYRDLRGAPEFSAVPVVLITGVTGPGGARDTERFFSTRGHVPPPDGFIGKPIDPEELLAVVGKLLG